MMHHETSWITLNPTEDVYHDVKLSVKEIGNIVTPLGKALPISLPFAASPPFVNQFRENGAGNLE